MKHLLSASLLIALFVVLSTSSMFAQATASATATATIVTPIAISKTVDMNFGNVAVITSGTVELGTDGSRLKTGGVTLPSISGTVSAASFSVTGQGSYTYSISLPEGDYTITNSNNNTMAVNNFISNPAVADGGQLTLGAQTLLVGATLNVDAAQDPGVYTNETGFDVTVNYN